MAKTSKTIRARLHFIEEVLGTASANKELHSEYIASKAPDAKKREDEVAAIGVEAATEKAMTIFPRNERGEKILWGYQIKGFLKAAQKTLNMLHVKGEAEYLPNYKSKVDNLVFVKAVTDSWKDRDHGIVIHEPEGVKAEDCERPLRAETAQGPRVTLAHSETCPAGSVIEVDIMSLDGALEGNIVEWLNAGMHYGIGQWRNSGKGRFLWEEIDPETGAVIGGNYDD